MSREERRKKYQKTEKEVIPIDPETGEQFTKNKWKKEKKKRAAAAKKEKKRLAALKRKEEQDKKNAAKKKQQEEEGETEEPELDEAEYYDARCKQVTGLIQTKNPYPYPHKFQVSHTHV